MPVWPTRPVDEQDCLTLRSWQVFQLSSGDLHLVGYCVENREGRVSSVVREIDVNNMRARTRSGRTYALTGRPGFNRDAGHVWERWVALNAADAWEDITNSIWQQHVDSLDSM